MLNLEKNKINNELIALKKQIRQAKVCTINKLVRKIRNWKREKSDDIESTNHKYIDFKIDKLNEQIQYLKHINNLELAKIVLTNTKKSEKILTNANAKSCDIAQSYICINKKIKQRILEIKEKYNLNNLENWQKMILEIGNRRKGEMKKKTYKLKKHSSEYVKRNKESRAIQEKRFSPKNIDVSNVTDVIDKKMIKRKHPENPARKLNINKKNKTIDDTVHTANYMSTAKIKNRDKSENISNSKNKYNDKCGTPKSKGTQLMVKDGINHSTEKIHPSWAAKQRQKGIMEFTGKSIKFDDKSAIDNRLITNSKLKKDKEEKKVAIHPSWQAKQKQKVNISAFKGTKIKFNID